MLTAGEAARAHEYAVRGAQRYEDLLQSARRVVATEQEQCVLNATVYRPKGGGSITISGGPAQPVEPPIDHAQQVDTLVAAHVPSIERSGEVGEPVPYVKAVPRKAGDAAVHCQTRYRACEVHACRGRPRSYVDPALAEDCAQLP